MAVTRTESAPGVPRSILALGFVAGLMAICQGPAAALTPQRQDNPPLRVFRIGFTGIMCVRPPCPSSGVTAEAPLPGERPNWPLWWGETDPPFSADPAMTAHIMSAWRAGTCLRVEGLWQRNALAVRRIIGPCNLR